MRSIEQLPTNTIVIGCIPARALPIAFVCRLEPSRRIVEVIDHDCSKVLQGDDCPTHFEYLPDSIDTYLRGDA